MIMILKFILGLVDPIGRIVEKIAEARIKAQDAKTDQKRIESLERVKALEARRDVLVAESRSPVNSIVRAFLVAPAGFFLWKVIVWDKVLAWGVTDDLSQNLWLYVFTVIGFYFADDMVSRWRRKT